MKQALETLVIETRERGLHDFTYQVERWVGGSGIKDGLLTLFIRHTSASLIIQENADPTVLSDLERYFERLVPDGDAIYDHTLEGPDDMPAHVRAALTQTHLAVPVKAGVLMLGTWQGLYLYEHRHHGHRREVVMHLMGS